jgi:hypothetical protein
MNTMQAKQAQILRDEWGDKPCNHPNYEKEYYLGANTGDKVCTQCGQVLSKDEIENIHRKQKKR